MQLLTGDDLLEIVAQNPDKHYELIEGELIEMPPAGIAHNNVEGAATVLLVWVIYPQTQHIHVFQHGQQPLILRADDTITGEPALPGFRAAVREFF